MAELKDIVVDCARPSALARFWAAAVDGYRIAPYDEAELARLALLGVHDIEDDPTVLVEGPTAGPRLWFQRVPEPKAHKNRVHLDLATADVEAEVARLAELGAAVVARHPDGHVVLHDPEGNEFCLQRS